ncbi:DedA family protein [Streptomyces radicis]|uniref:DedA family protein n=1 Tax=Streptomyces radicis TaxID=1750517 RepID=A0A3A9VXM4_9ACTN|nr:DedA family protein [Streptomyces radicis]RKN05499.1 DedA family protein [Streptomyces radicis]RKN17368.1 DedA family protein [Streptomyces radicis]
MDNAIIEAIEGFVATPWVYVALFAVAKLDGFFPVVPSETLVVTLGVFAAADGGPNGNPNLFLIIAVAALGAFTGDHISYYIGRKSGTRIYSRLKQGSRTQRAYDQVGEMLKKRGGVVLIIARYIPGGRTAATLTTGATKYPLKYFSRYDAIAALSWAVYSAGIGYIGGTAFEDNPLLGVAVGLGLALTIAVLHEGFRILRARRSRKRKGTAPAAD